MKSIIYFLKNPSLFGIAIVVALLFTLGMFYSSCTEDNLKEEEVISLDTRSSILTPLQRVQHLLLYHKEHMTIIEPFLRKKLYWV